MATKVAPAKSLPVWKVERCPMHLRLEMVRSFVAHFLIIDGFHWPANGAKRLQVGSRCVLEIIDSICKA